MNRRRQPANQPGEFNLEEALRRLMGEEPPEPAPAPPPIPRAAQGELPPVPAWEEEEPTPASQDKPSRLCIAPPIAVAQASITTTAASEQQKEAARRFEQLNEQGRHPATVVGRGRGTSFARGQAGRLTVARSPERAPGLCGLDCVRPAERSGALTRGWPGLACNHGTHHHVVDSGSDSALPGNPAARHDRRPHRLHLPDGRGDSWLPGFWLSDGQPDSGRRAGGTADRHLVLAQVLPREPHRRRDSSPTIL